MNRSSRPRPEVVVDSLPVVVVAVAAACGLDHRPVGDRKPLATVLTPTVDATDHALAVVEVDKEGLAWAGRCPGRTHRRRGFGYDTDRAELVGDDDVRSTPSRVR